MDWFIYALATAGLAAASTLIQKKTLNREHALEFSASLATVNLLFAFIFLPQVDFDIGLKTYLLIYAASWLGAVAFLLVAKAVRHMEISSSSPILNFGPAITALLAFIILGEKLTSLQVWGIGLLVLGAYVLEIRGELKNVLAPVMKIARNRYARLMLLALLLYGFSALADRFILTSGVNPETYLFIVHIFIFINFIILMTVMHDGIIGVKNGLRKSGKWILLVAALTVGYRFFQMKAISMMYVGLVVAIKRVSTLITTLVGGRIYHETNLLVKVLGCIIMLWGVVFIIL